MAGLAWWERAWSGGHDGVQHKMLDTGFGAAASGAQKEWSWWRAGPAGTRVWLVRGGVWRVDLGGRTDGHWVQIEVGRAVMQWPRKGDGEFGFECVSLRCFPGQRNVVWEAHFPRFWWFLVATLSEALFGRRAEERPCPTHSRERMVGFHAPAGEGF